MKYTILKNLSIIIFSLSMSGAASAYVITPAVDGYIDVNATNPINTSSYLKVSDSIRSIVKFSLDSLLPDTSVQLSLSIGGIPLFHHAVDVFGYATNDASISYDDYDKGLHLGRLQFSGYDMVGDETELDVSLFINSLSSDYAGFNLRTPGGITDFYGSLETTRITPSQLRVQSVQNVPEPPMLLLLGTVLAGLIGSKRNQS